MLELPNCCLYLRRLTQTAEHFYRTVECVVELQRAVVVERVALPVVAVLTVVELVRVERFAVVVMTVVGVERLELAVAAVMKADTAEEPVGIAVERAVVAAGV